MGGPPSSVIRILLVDDDPDLRDTTAALLGDTYEVKVAASGKEALRLIEKEPFDVVCTDYRMGGMDGIELLKAAQKVQGFVAGILVTAYADYHSFQQQLKGLHFHVLVKPYETEQLVLMIERGAKLTRMRRSAAKTSAEADRLNRPGKP